MTRAAGTFEEAILELIQDCNYYQLGRCETAGCHRTNGCAIARVAHHINELEKHRSDIEQICQQTLNDDPCSVSSWKEDVERILEIAEGMEQ